MIHLVIAASGAAISVFAFPPFGPGWLIAVGVGLFLTALRRCENREQGLAVGAIYGLGFFGGLMWWLSELGIIAVIPLVVVQAAYLLIYAFWLSGHNDKPTVVWFAYAVGGWALMELVRYHFPVGGLEWGAAGYALSDASWSRLPAGAIGTTGLTVLVVALAALGALSITKKLNWLAALPTLALVSVVALWVADYRVDFEELFEPGANRILVVQGSTPCPYEHCPPDERLGTFEQHLALTQTIEASGDIKLVIWSEGSTGSTNADPVQNPEIGRAIAEQARRLDAWFLVGSDRPLNDEDWVNANVVFNPEGEIVGEYHKQHPVPFGEYIPLRPLFDWIPALDAVPRDMIRGDGPVLFDIQGPLMGSVISFEGGFSRYAREHVIEGAQLLVVATNEGSYERTPASDQFIGMTRMRATELGIQVVHAAVTGKSVFIDDRGGLSQTTGLATIELLEGTLEPYRGQTPYARFGDVLIWSAALAGLVTGGAQRLLVGSPRAVRVEEEEDVGGVGEPAS